MIPFFKFTHFYIGPARIYVWGLMVAIGIIVGTIFALKSARRNGLNVDKFEHAIFWIILFSFISARLGHVLFYELSYYTLNFFEIFKIWHGGMSSYGGFIGGTIAGLWILRDERTRLWQYADCAVYGGVIGWIIGRIGCFLIHDHLGILSNFILAVKQLDGTSRHDLGLYDGFLAFIIFLMFFLLRKKKLRAGVFSVLFMFFYGVGRFFLDFLRAADLPNSDARYFNFTPAQYFSVLMVVFSIYFILRILYKKKW